MKTRFSDKMRGPWTRMAGWFKRSKSNANRTGDAPPQQKAAG